MIITGNPGETLEQCFTWQKLSPSGMEQVNPKIDLSFGPGTRFRITHDKKGNLTQIPIQRRDAKDSKPGRKSTTSKVATGILIVGKILAAADHPHPDLRNFLRFLYDPECSNSIKRKVECWVCRATLRTLPEATRANKVRNLSAIIWPMMLDFSQRIRMGEPRYSPLYYCQTMGFAGVTDANWARDYADVFAAILLWLQEQENKAIGPVMRVIENYFQDDEEDYRHQENARGVAKAKEARRMVMPVSTLTLRRV